MAQYFGASSRRLKNRLTIALLNPIRAGKNWYDKSLKHIPVIFMNDDFYKERARQVRAMAERADPFIKKRLLDLANRYDNNTTKRVTPLPAVPIKDHARDKNSGGDPG